MSDQKVSPELAHRLELYRRAVQHPQAEAAFLHRAYRQLNQALPYLLREDFAGSAAVAAAWVEMDEENQAMAVESDHPTACFAEQSAHEQLGERAGDLHVVEADVLDLESPKVDVTCALNFSTFTYHDRASLKQYLKSARRGLKRDGLLILDAYGGPGAMRISTQSRTVPAADGQPGFTYQWEQRAFDPVTHRTECHIHFNLDTGERLESAFIYRWRLWSLPELVELMLEAGFKAAEPWCDTFNADLESSDGIYEPISQMAAREDWVAYVVGRK